MGGVNEFFEHYMDIMSDPAHLAAEVTLMLLVDVLFLGLVWPFLRKWMTNRLRAEHRVLDQEHGVTHPEGTP